MANQSINGRIISNSGSHDFTAYYLIVSFDITVASSTAFQSTRTLVKSDGSFRFFLPEASRIVEKITLLEVFAPNGSLLHRDHYTLDSLDPSSKTITEADDTIELEIAVDPLLISEDKFLLENNVLKGRVVDISGKKVPAGLQVIIWATKDSTNPQFDSSIYTPIFVGETDGSSHFSGRYNVDDYKSSFATINGKLEHPISITLTSNRLSSFILLPFSGDSSSDFYSDDSDCDCHDDAPRLPDSADLISNGKDFSSDLGGKCNVKFKPNRSLEEVSFCAITRTSDPEIQRSTISAPELYEIKQSMQDVFTSLRKNFSKLEKHAQDISVNKELIEDLQALNQAEPLVGPISE